MILVNDLGHVNDPFELKLPVSNPFKLYALVI